FILMLSLSHRTFNDPTTPDARAQQFVSHSHLACPIAQQLSFTLVFQVGVGPHVALLLFRCCPPTVSSLIIAVRVGQTIKRSSGGALFHIRLEVHEVHPALANLDASSTVVCVPWVIWVEAPLLHHAPTRIRPRLVLGMSFAVDSSWHSRAPFPSVRQLLSSARSSCTVYSEGTPSVVLSTA